MNKNIPYFMFFRCKHEYQTEYLNHIPLDQYDETLKAEMASAYDRYNRYTEMFFSEAHEPEEFWVDGFMISENDENVTYLDSLESASGAMYRWFRDRFKTDVCRHGTFFIRMNFYDIIDLANACAKACGENDHAYYNGVSKTLCQKYYPAERCAKSDSGFYGLYYREELMSTLRTIKYILMHTDFDTEFIYVRIKVI